MIPLNFPCLILSVRMVKYRLMLLNNAINLFYVFVVLSEHDMLDLGGAYLTLLKEGFPLRGRELNVKIVETVHLLISKMTNAKSM